MDLLKNVYLFYGGYQTEETQNLWEVKFAASFRWAGSLQDNKSFSQRRVAAWCETPPPLKNAL